MNISSQLQSLAQELGAWVEAHIVNIIVILIGAWIVRRFGVKVVNQILKRTVRADFYPSEADRKKRYETLSSLGSAFIRVAVYFIAGVLILGEINPSYTAALFASAGLISVALGFGAQSLVRDVVSGIFIISENQYRIGDEVEFVGTTGLGKIKGEVEAVTVRTTILRDLDGDVHHIPNGNIGFTTNMTSGYSRINEDIVVDSTTDLELLEHIVTHVGEELKAMPSLSKKVIEPPYIASIKGFSDKGIVIKILAKTTPADQWHVRSEMYKKLNQAFRKNKIKLGS